MYPIVLFLHSLLRWIVLVLAIVAVVRAIMGMTGKKTFTRADDKTSVAFVAALDTQLLVGLLLYVVLSPFTRTAFAAFGGAMKDHVLRFWAVEHVFAMLLAVVLAHVGRVMVKRADSDASKHKRALVCFGLSLLFMLGGIPWPLKALPYARPLLSLP